MFSASEPKTTLDTVRTLVGPDSIIVGMLRVDSGTGDDTTFETESWTVTDVADKDDAWKIRSGEQVIQADQGIFKVIYQVNGRYGTKNAPTRLEFRAVVSPSDRPHPPFGTILVIYCRVTDSGFVARYYGPGNGTAIDRDWVITLPQNARVRTSTKTREETLDLDMLCEVS